MSTEPRATGTLDEIGRRDHEVTSEYRIFGPPGTGKTTNLTRQIHRAVERFGTDSVLVTSFSRAAAAELAGRDLPISNDRVGTLHSHCWHALGGPKIAEAHVDDWNKDHPSLAITPQKERGALDGEEGAEDSMDRERNGDDELQRLNRLRGMMQPREFWPATALEFERRWTEYKRANGLLDFTDLIETALRDCYTAPHNPSVIFADEAQDLNRMQLSLVRKWGERASYFIVAGDDDQTIYSFTGAAPEAFLQPDIPDDHKIVLKQSYRVPRAVHHFAEALIQTVTVRQPKEYLPRPEEGALDRLSKVDTYQRAEYEILKSATAHIESGRTVMFLASCAYMLRPIVTVLRKHGIPFHNPYRRSNGFWNPLRIKSRTATLNRILALLIGHPDYGDAHRAWTHGDLALWSEWLEAKNTLLRGAKSKLKAGDATHPVTIDELAGVFEPGALDSLMAAWDGGSGALLEWWRARLVRDARKRAEFPVEVAQKRGAQALLDEPPVVVGTIHSVKGGERDVVYLFPDLSQAGDAQYARGGAARDSVVRQFYVGATRARERLCICGRATQMAISL